MNLFRNKKNEEIKHLLQSTKQDFRFDQENLKARLMMSVNAGHLSKDEAKQLVYKPNLWPKYSVVAVLALIIVSGTTGLTFASSKSQPGSALYKVQKFQNQAILSLPLPETKKEEIRTDIAAKRVAELESFSLEDEIDEVSLEAGLEESYESIDVALVKISAQLEKTSEPSAKVTALMEKLDNVSIKHQKRLELLKTKVKNERLKKKIEKNLTEIEVKRSKLHKDKNMEDDSDKSGDRD